MWWSCNQTGDGQKLVIGVAPPSRKKLFRGRALEYTLAPRSQLQRAMGVLCASD